MTPDEVMGILARFRSLHCGLGNPQCELCQNAGRALEQYRDMLARRGDVSVRLDSQNEYILRQQHILREQQRQQEFSSSLRPRPIPGSSGGLLSELQEIRERNFVERVNKKLPVRRIKK